MIKKTLTALSLLMICLFANGQTPFEGEVDFTTFANYCDYINKHGLMAGGNGIHRQTLTVKGDKGKLVNHTTGSVTVWDNSTGQYITYIPELKKGIDYSGYMEGMMVLLPHDTKLYGQYDQRVTSNTIKATDAKENIEGRECSQMKGTLVREQGGRDSRYGITLFYDPNAGVTSGLKSALYGLDVPGLPMKWTYAYDGGHVPAVGELSFYMENTVTDVRPGSVDDTVFAFPSGKKVKRGDTTADPEMSGYKLVSPKNAFALMGYFKEANNYANKRIEAEKKSGQQAGYETFQTSGEWDF